VVPWSIIDEQIGKFIVNESVETMMKVVLKTLRRINKQLVVQSPDAQERLSNYFVQIRKEWDTLATEKWKGPTT